MREGIIIGKIEPWAIETKPVPKDSPSSAGRKSAIRSAWLSSLSFNDRKSKQNGVENYNIGFNDITCKSPKQRLITKEYIVTHTNLFLLFYYQLYQLGIGGYTFKLTLYSSDKMF